MEARTHEIISEARRPELDVSKCHTVTDFDYDISGNFARAGDMRLLECRGVLASRWGQWPGGDRLIPEQQEKDKRRGHLTDAVGIIRGGFHREHPYSTALSNTLSNEQFFEVLGNQELLMANTALKKQLLAARTADFDAQALALNRYINEDEPLWVVINDREDEHYKTMSAARLDGFFVDNNVDQGPKPGLLLKDLEGNTGIVPMSFFPLGVFIEAKSR